MTITHISDTHGQHANLQIPTCDVLIFSGDYSAGKGNLADLLDFLGWFEQQSAKLRLFVAGNHDLVLDKQEAQKHKAAGNTFGYLRALEGYTSAQDLIKNYNVTYLCNTGVNYEGLTFYGSPITPSFHRETWAFNADRGEEICKYWNGIPSTTNVLITHGPPYGILDVTTNQKGDAYEHAGCQDLMNVIKKRLFSLKLCCFGHLHEQFGVVQRPVSNTRNCLFSNGAVLTDRHKLLITEPLIITI